MLSPTQSKVHTPPLAVLKSTRFQNVACDTYVNHIILKTTIVILHAIDAPTFGGKTKAIYYSSQDPTIKISMDLTKRGQKFLKVNKKKPLLYKNDCKYIML